jgi:hypothetical protein
MVAYSSNVPRDLSADAFRSYIWDFEIFLKVIPLIVDEWHRDPTLIHFGGLSEDLPPRERVASSAFGPDKVLHPIFDRDNFIAAVYDWQHLSARNPRNR